MVSHLVCQVCGTIISKQYINSERWKAVGQELRIGDTGLLVDPSTGWTSSDTHVIHATCWSVVKKVFESYGIVDDQIDRGLLSLFRRTLDDLDPFLIAVPWKEKPPSTNDLCSYLDNLETAGSSATSDIYQEPPNTFLKSSQREPRSGMLKSLADLLKTIPPEVIQLIYSYLSSYHDFQTLQAIVLHVADTRSWLHLGKKYRSCNARFMNGTPQEISCRIQQALRARYDPCLHFPQTINYEIIWDNVELVLSRMGQPLLGNDASYPLPTRVIEPFDHWMKPSNTNIVTRSRMIIVTACIVWTVNFDRVGEKDYICGFCFDDVAFGYKGSSSKTMTLESLSGLRLYCDEKGYVDSQAQDCGNWLDCLKRRRSQNLMVGQVFLAPKRDTPVHIIATFDVSTAQYNVCTRAR